MPQVSVSRVVPEDLEQVWARIGRFEDPNWLPGVTLSHMEDETRVLSVPPSQTIRETLLSSGEYVMSWATAETPLPIADAVTTLSAKAVDDGTEVTWACTFTATQQVNAQAEAMMTSMVSDMLAAVAVDESIGETTD